MKRLSLVLTLATLAGCGNDPSPLTPAQFISQRATIECAAISSACLMPEATCAAGRQATYTAEQQNAMSSLPMRAFVPANADACLGKVKEVYGKLQQGAVALAASDYVALTVICAGVYRGLATENQACRIDLDCSEGLICDDPKGYDTGHCGIPRLVALGAGCANIGEYCPAGSYCANPNGVWVCAPKVAAQGVCSDATPCSEALRCSASLCVERLPVGQPCASNDDCGSGFCEPYALKCANDIRFANGSAACIAMGGS